MNARATIRRGFVEAGDVRRAETMKSGEAPDRDCNRSWKCKRDRDAGSRQGPQDDVETRCAQRAPNGALALFLTHADDEEHERDRSQKCHECGPGSRAEVVIEKPQHYCVLTSKV